MRENRHFRFTAKLWRGFTHERTASPHDERLYTEGFAPLLDAGKFGALLLQFPWSFRNSPENRGYVASLCARFADYPLVLEVRHASWAEPGVLDWLAGPIPETPTDRAIREQGERLSKAFPEIDFDKRLSGR